MPNIDEMWAGVRDAVTVRRVFGEPIERDGVTIVPVAAVRGAGGGGGDTAGNGGGGFAIGAWPAGVYVIDEGRVEWKPAVPVGRIVLGGQVAAVAALLVLRSLLRTRRG
jgi:uncharacterized spore protein YtfJ